MTIIKLKGSIELYIDEKLSSGDWDYEKITEKTPNAFHKNEKALLSFFCFWTFNNNKDGYFFEETEYPKGFRKRERQHSLTNSELPDINSQD